MGSNVMFVVDELFKSIQVKTVGPLHPTHGFSSFKFLPYSKDEIIGLLFYGNILYSLDITSTFQSKVSYNLWHFKINETNLE